MLEDDMQLAKLSNRQSLPRRDLTSVVFAGLQVPGGNICKYSTIRYYIPALWGFVQDLEEFDRNYYYSILQPYKT